MLTAWPQQADRTEDKRPTPPPNQTANAPDHHRALTARARGSRRRHARPQPRSSPASVTLRPSAMPPRGSCRLPPPSPPDPHHRNLMRRAHAAGPLGHRHATARRRSPCWSRLDGEPLRHARRVWGHPEGRTRGRAPRPRPPTPGEGRSSEERLEEAIELGLGDDPASTRLGRSLGRARCRATGPALSGSSVAGESRAR